MIGELSLLRGDPFKVNDYITVLHPTLGQIADFGEQAYLSIIQRLCATPADFLLSLHDIGVDYEEITDFQLFLLFYPTMPPDETHIVLGDVDLTKYSPEINSQNGEVILVNRETDSVIDSAIHTQITNYIRRINGLERTVMYAGNAHTKEYLIRRERRRMEQQRRKKFKSTLSPLVSALCNCEQSKCDYRTVWGMPIYVFYDSIKRIQKIKSTNNLLTGIYSGGIDAKKIPPDSLNWLGDIS